MNCNDLQKIENRNISVITNFGCRANCWYCIWKGHNLEHVNPGTDWKKLEEFLEKYKGKGKISLSGGGDCLYKYEDHKIWWHQFLYLINDKKLKLDIHTREKFLYMTKADKDILFKSAGNWFKQHINRVVFSSDHLDIYNKNIDKEMTDREYLTWLSEFVKIRIVHLVTKDTSFGMIENYIKFCQEHDMQFTIKHLIGYDDGNMYNLIRKKYPDIFYLDDGDYNIYYMPDNTVQEKFLN